MPIVAGLLAAGGCAALIYQIVWFQLLSLVVGASAVSLGVLLATFMGGLCLGSWLFPKYVPRRHHPLLVLGLLELGIGVLGLLVLYGMPLIDSVYGALAGEGVAGLIIRAIIAALCLLPATVLMGATLPAVSRWAETSPPGVVRLGLLYAANIAGGAIGSVLAGFYLLRVFDTAIATYVAVALNLFVLVVGFTLAKLVPRSFDGAEAGTPEAAAAGAPIYAIVALSGLTALAAEVVWTRHLSLLFGATVYTFSMILAVFLVGLGLGSWAGALLSRSASPRAALGYTQLGLCFAIAWAAWGIARSLPFWPLDVTLATSPWIMLEIDALRTFAVVLPGAVLWGASFPLALAAAAERGRDPASLVGGLYAANTVGAIVGALATSLWIIPWLGGRATQQVMIAFAALAAIVAFVGLWKQGERRVAARAGALLVIGLALVPSVPELPPHFVAYGRFAPTRGQGVDVLYVGEGITATIAISQDAYGIRSYHNAGKPQATSWPQDMRLQRMLGHLTTLAVDNPKQVLTIGFGAGVTAGAVSIDPMLEKLVIADIEALAPNAAGEYFGEHNFYVRDNPKVDIRIDDGRHYLATTPLKFDGITSDPLDPWVKGAAALYTVEFWELVKSRLNPGGVVTVFVQLYESTEAAVKSEVATFFEVFPNGAVFANTIEGTGYDVVLLARGDGSAIDVEGMQARLSSPEYHQVWQSLREVGFSSAADLLGTYAGGREDLAAWMAGAEINRDRNLRLQYLAGQGLNLYHAGPIFTNMTAGRLAFPDALFKGSAEQLARIRQTMDSGRLAPE